MNYSNQRLKPIPIPTIANRAIITANMITDTSDIAKAFNHPQSKKCFTSPSNIIKRIIDAIIPENNELKTVLITVPRTTIQIASTNFALLLPTKIRPANQRTGAIIIIFTII